MPTSMEATAIRTTGAQGSARTVWSGMESAKWTALTRHVCSTVETVLTADYLASRRAGTETSIATRSATMYYVSTTEVTALIVPEVAMET